MLDHREIEAGLVNGEFFLEYQPVIDLGSGRCVGGEALSRWRRPDGTVLPPQDFLPAIEDTPVIGLLTYFVVERIAAEFLDWLPANEAFISVNVPPEIIGRGGLRYVAEKTGLMAVASKIIVEITERGIPDRIAFEAIGRAAEYGIRVALDDVGTGGENIVVLSRCNIPMIKLDRLLVAQVRQGAALPREIDEIAHLLASGKFQVIAEGVESAHQAEVLNGLGIKLAQGFFLAKPLPADAFKAFFAQRLRGQADRSY